MKISARSYIIYIEKDLFENWKVKNEKIKGRKYTLFFVWMILN